MNEDHTAVRAWRKRQRAEKKAIKQLMVSPDKAQLVIDAINHYPALYWVVYRFVAHADWIRLANRALTQDERAHLYQTEMEARAILNQIKVRP